MGVALVIDTPPEVDPWRELELLPADQVSLEVAEVGKPGRELAFEDDLDA